MSRRSVRTNTCIVLGLLSSLSLTGGAGLSAQSSFDGEIAGAQHWQVVLDAMAHPASRSGQGWVWLNPRVYRGLGSDVELGIGTSIYTHANGGPSTLQPSVKWRGWRGTPLQLAVVAGGQAQLALDADSDSHALMFASVEHTIGSPDRPMGAIAVGPYALTGLVPASPAHRHGMVVSGWASLQSFRVNVSWVSGHNAFGIQTALVSVPLSSQYQISAGYSRSNAAGDTGGPYLSLGIQP